MKRLPHFLIVGAAKSATSWLARALGQHPHLNMAEGEVHYFSRHFNRPLSWYRSRMPRSSVGITGERSNSYLYWPEIAERVGSVLPECRIVASLRDPVDRAYSDYCMHFVRGTVDADVEFHLDPNRKPDDNLFLSQGFYLQHLAPYISKFGGDNVHVMLFDSIRQDGDLVLEGVSRFLGLDHTRLPQPLLNSTNVRPSSHLPGILVCLNALARRLPAFHWSVRRIPRRVRRLMVSRLRSEPVEYPVPSPRLIKKLEEFYAPEVDRLGDFLHRDLSAWGRHDDLLELGSAARGGASASTRTLGRKSQFRVQGRLLLGSSIEKAGSSSLRPTSQAE